ncbi:hypothetical protein B0T25DRAFT_579224 [Lasiosphaeria hispida]|uniref:Peroxin 11C n=1 Tax=Lasiosphaeria hispida TaxID=260671 RepID=A0AAJ0HLI4_9PEZI|nr:hypothetical protein B0T25DRAFT_579224 [Lasiosphaeria hispida]
MASIAPETDVPVTADLPSGSPIPSVAATTPSKPAAPLTPPLRALLAATPSHLDAFLARLNKCLATPAGIDTVLLFVCYASRLSASALGALSRSVLRRSARDWLAVLAALPPRTTVLFASSSSSSSAVKVAVVTAGGSTTTAAAAAALVLAGRLKALSGLLSEARTILRLWALLGMYFWGKGLVVKALSPAAEKKKSSGEPEGEETRLDRVVEWTRLLLCVGLQTLENGAYLSSRGVLGWTPAQQGKAYKWSSRFWAAYVGIELGKLAAEGLAGSKAKKAKADAEVDADTAEWRKKVARNLAWMPLTLHWSTDAGFVSEPLIGMLASIPGMIQMRDLWRSTALPSAK